MCDIANLPQASLLFSFSSVLLPCSLTALLTVRRRVLGLFHICRVEGRVVSRSCCCEACYKEVHCRLAGVIVKRLFGLPQSMLSLVSSLIRVDWVWKQEQDDAGEAGDM